MVNGIPQTDGAGGEAREERRIVIARVAELAFFLITLFFSMGLGSDGPAEAMIRARLLFEAALALGVFLALGIRPRPGKVAGIVLAAYVLIGCTSNLARIPQAISAGIDASGWMALGLVLAGCVCQGVVLLACLPPRRPSRPAP